MSTCSLSSAFRVLVTKNNKRNSQDGRHGDCALIIMEETDVPQLICENMGVLGVSGE